MRSGFLITSPSFKTSFYSIHFSLLEWFHMLSAAKIRKKLAAQAFWPYRMWKLKRDVRQRGKHLGALLCSCFLGSKAFLTPIDLSGTACVMMFSPESHNWPLRVRHLCNAKTKHLSPWKPLSRHRTYFLVPLSAGMFLPWQLLLSSSRL